MITAKGRALLALLDELRAIHIDKRLKFDPRDYEHGRATPCAPNRAAPAAPGNKTTKPGTAAAHPRTPAGKSGAAPLATKPQASASQPSDTAAQLSEPGTTKPETDQ